MFLGLIKSKSKSSLSPLASTVDEVIAKWEQEDLLKDKDIVRIYLGSFSKKGNFLCYPKSDPFVEFTWGKRSSEYFEELYTVIDSRNN